MNILVDIIHPAHVHFFKNAIKIWQQGFKRCLSFLAFLQLASVIVLFVGKVDAVYATSTPLTVGIPALVAKWFRRKRVIFEVRDRWPESPVEIGVIKNNLLIKVLLWFEGVVYKNSAAM